MSRILQRISSSKKCDPLPNADSPPRTTAYWFHFKRKHLVRLLPKRTKTSSKFFAARLLLFQIILIVGSMPLKPGITHGSSSRSSSGGGGGAAAVAAAAAAAGAISAMYMSELLHRRTPRRAAAADATGFACLLRCTRCIPWLGRHFINEYSTAL
jgi:hypothetical protein